MFALRAAVLGLVALAALLLGGAREADAGRQRGAAAGGSWAAHRGASPHHGFRHGPHFGTRHRAPSVFPRPVDPWKSWGKMVHPRPFGHQPKFGRFFPHFAGGTTVVAVSPIVTAAPVVAYPEPVYVATPVVVPTVVEYPTGWYELRGDGVTTPYRWVWIPKPPPPPVEAPAPAPPASPAPAAPTPEARPVPPAYRWVDEHGVVTWTNRLDRVPPDHRDDAPVRPGHRDGPPAPPDRRDEPAEAAPADPEPN